ncbi:hypothetical protein BBJ28_00020356 [Nothophytophthora sp. Chile5]|nr:hypothetical protein BBJ28_00020356 [Nothophytophthora sp. Chile5]
MTVFTPDASKVQTEELCAADCLVWLESVADIPTCGDAEMQEYQRLMAAYQTQCSQRKRVRLQANKDTQQATMRLRGLAATDAAEAHDDKRRLATAGGAGETDRGWRKLSVKGLMDALLVVTLNNAL